MKKYKWANNEIPIIDAHSINKHKVLGDYLRKYLLIVGGNPYHRSSLVLTLVDGFAGGGLYRTDSGHLHEGSPLLLLKTCEATAYEIAQSKNMDFRLDAQYIFIEKEKQILNFLKDTLKQKGYDSRIEKDIFLIENKFEMAIDTIIKHIENRPGRARRCIFLLDQFGYSDVAISTIFKIFSRLPKAEVILIYMVDWLIDYLNSSPECEQLIKNLDLQFDLCNLQSDKQQKNWRFYIQHNIYEQIVSKSGALYYTNYFIKSRESNKSYWLLHLSMHSRARDAMQEIHWEIGNTFVHEGGAGLYMLGYDPHKDIDITHQPSFTFSSFDKERAHKSLLEQIPEALSATEGISVSHFFNSQCNQSTATYDMMKNAFIELYNNREIEIYTKLGNIKKKGSNLNDDDAILRRRQKYISF